MGEPIAVLALRRRRDHISGTIAEYERKIKEAQHDLIHVVASLRLFELATMAPGAVLDARYTWFPRFFRNSVLLPA